MKSIHRKCHPPHKLCRDAAFTIIGAKEQDVLTAIRETARRTQHAKRDRGRVERAEVGARDGLLHGARGLGSGGICRLFPRSAQTLAVSYRFTFDIALGDDGQNPFLRYEGAPSILFEPSSCRSWAPAVRCRSRGVPLHTCILAFTCGSGLSSLKLIDNRVMSAM